MALVPYCRINLTMEAHDVYGAIVYVIFEVFTALTVKNAVFWDVAPCRYCVIRRFGGTCHLEIRSQSFLPWRWRQYIPPKHRFIQDVHGAASQKTAWIDIDSTELDGSIDDASHLYVPDTGSNFAREADFPGCFFFHSFPLFLQANAGMLQFRPLSFSRIFFAIHYSLLILPFDPL
jgi:hypothetical protein